MDCSWLLISALSSLPVVYVSLAYAIFIGPVPLRFMEWALLGWAIGGWGFLGSDVGGWDYLG
jgi:hypothetical protein